MNNLFKSFKNIFISMLLISILSGCASSFNMPDWLDADTARERDAAREAKRDGGPKGKIQDNFKLFGTDTKDTGATIGVNALLWRASLDTVSFMPLEQADPYGGIIMTEWYTNPDKPNERYKITIYILDTRLRADAIRVSFFMQQLINGEWTNVATSDETRIALENSILTKARQFKQE
jgi:hypothetical protein